MDCPICRRDMAFLEDCRLLPCELSCILCLTCLKDYIDRNQVKLNDNFLCPSCDNWVKLSEIGIESFKRINIDKKSSIKMQQLIYVEKKRIMEKRSQEIDKIKRRAIQLNALIAKRQIYLIQEMNKLYNTKVAECERGIGLYEKNMEIILNNKEAIGKNDGITLKIDYEYEKDIDNKLPEFFPENYSIFLGRIDEFDDEKPLHIKFTELIKPTEMISSDDCCYLKTNMNILRISNSIEIEFSSMMVKYPVVFAGLDISDVNVSKDRTLYGIKYDSFKSFQIHRWKTRDQTIDKCNYDMCQTLISSNDHDLISFLAKDDLIIFDVNLKQVSIKRNFYSTNFRPLTIFRDGYLFALQTNFNFVCYKLNNINGKLFLDGIIETTIMEGRYSIRKDIINELRRGCLLLTDDKFIYVIDIKTRTAKAFLQQKNYESGILKGYYININYIHFYYWKTNSLCKTECYNY